MFERLKHMLIKEFIQVFRDPRMRIVIFLIPCFQVFVIGYAISTDVKHVRTAVYDLDNSQASRDVAARFVRSGYFDVVARVGDENVARGTEVEVRPDKTVHFRFTYFWNLPSPPASGPDDSPSDTFHWWEIDVLPSGKAILSAEGGAPFGSHVGNPRR